MGVAVWPMVELEADDALASAARLAAPTSASRRSASGRPTRIWRSASASDRVVQVDRRASKIRNAAGVREKFGVDPALIPDFLALVGDAADGYPGIPGSAQTAARLLNRHGPIESFPPASRRAPRAGAAVQGPGDAADRRAALRDLDELRWRGPTPAFAAYAERLGDARLLERCLGAPID